MLISVLVGFAIFIFSVVLHEIAHGWVAVKLGDLTPKLDGRLTLNPMAHADLWGSVLIPLMCLISGAPVFGWAKPVETHYVGTVDIGKFRLNGDLLVSLAGVVMNFLLALAAGLLLRLMVLKMSSDVLWLAEILAQVVWINVLLGVFNLWPIPPLDGWRIWGVLLPFDWQMFIERYAMVFLMLLFWFANYLPTYWAAKILFSFITGIA